ncbi:CHY zinc finger protein [Salipaludibacillus sp. LMS25]|uniref:CHY zinc finger protein n=1 Tax=Salipaludibacillus sp. LMS25 TaxID=2924031 RepID=UPI0020D02F6D|nr:CHY zinc finger protein [Salipaludibacillus sp. LMS25]UTR16401.1 CHY zinc finger protein [Salipaludibacillus sp. LMS25]
MTQRQVVKGRTIDDETRCVHYHTKKDRIAIKFKCCMTYYPCIECHRETAGHPVIRWEPNDFKEMAILCGSCWNELTIDRYVYGKANCPFCHASFNSLCSNHYHHYFALNPPKT